MSYMAPSPPTTASGGHRAYSWSENWRQSKALKNAWSRCSRYSPASSSSASRTALKPSAIFTMWPSKAPMASDGLS